MTLSNVKPEKVKTHSSRTNGKRWHKYPIEIVKTIKNSRKNQIEIEFFGGKFSVGSCKRQLELVQKA